MIDHKLRVVIITNNLAEYPQHKDDTNEFPHLVEYVEDEEEIFIADPLNPDEFWTARDFFYCVNVREFLVDAQQLE